MKMNELTSIEMDWVKDLKLSSKQVADKLNLIDPDIIYQKRRRMGLLELPPYNRYTDEDYIILRDLSINNSEVAKILNRPNGDTIYQKRKKMGLITKIGSVKKFTKKELKLVNNKSLTNTRVAMLLNVPVRRVKNKRYNINIQNKKQTKINMRTRGKFNKSELKLIDDVTLTSKAISITLDTSLASIATVRARRGIKTLGKSIQGKKAILKLSAGKKAAATRKRNQEANSPEEIVTNTIKSYLNKEVIKVTSKDLTFIINGIPVTVDGKIKNAHIGLNKIELNF